MSPVHSFGSSSEVMPSRVSSNNIGNTIDAECQTTCTGEIVIISVYQPKEEKDKVLTPPPKK